MSIIQENKSVVHRSAELAAKENHSTIELNVKLTDGIFILNACLMPFQYYKLDSHIK